MDSYLAILLHTDMLINSAILLKLKFIKALIILVIYNLLFPEICFSSLNVLDFLCGVFSFDLILLIGFFSIKMLLHSKDV